MINKGTTIDLAQLNQNTQEMQDTQAKQNLDSPHSILQHVYYSLEQKGYNAISQLVGFVLTGDPTYITNFNEARSLICKLERYDILEELVKFYIENNFKRQ